MAATGTSARNRIPSAGSSFTELFDDVGRLAYFGYELVVMTNQSAPSFRLRTCGLEGRDAAERVRGGRAAPKVRTSSRPRRSGPARLLRRENLDLEPSRNRRCAARKERTHQTCRAPRIRFHVVVDPNANWPSSRCSSSAPNSYPWTSTSVAPSAAGVRASSSAEAA